MPPLLLPFIAFFLWLFAVFSYVPALKLDISLTLQTVWALFFISDLVVILAWAFSGPLATALLTAVFSLATLYMALVLKDATYLLQILFYAGVYTITFTYLQDVRNRAQNQEVKRERLTEDLNATREDIVKKGLLEEALQKKLRRFSDLQRFSEDLKEIHRLDDAYEKLVNQAYTMLGKAESAALYRVDESRQDLALVASKKKDAASAIKEKEGSVFDRWAMRHSHAVLVEDARSDFRFSIDAARADVLRSLCSSPLLTEKRVLGILRVSSSKPQSFSADDLRLLDILSDLGAVALRNISLYDEMAELAVRDSLTGFYVHRHFQTELADQVRRALTAGERFSLCLLDIDHFKRYNDQYGHPAGDLLLKNISMLVREYLRPVDIAARYGGEEFALVVPQVEPKEALALAEKIRKGVEQNEFILRRDLTRVTVSIGVAHFPRDGRSKEELLWTVDKNLYKAKSLGRNRVCGSS